jgi:SAM-dependent methyltransferase
MTQHKLFDDGTCDGAGVPYVSTAEFHHDRERAPHLEQPGHRPRLEVAARLVHMVVAGGTGVASVSDLGCGDGGLLQLLTQQGLTVPAWGYDFAPANLVGAAERGVDVRHADVFNGGFQVELGDVCVLTEVLEHVADPDAVLDWLRHEKISYVVASSPYTETPGDHSPEHAWAWDQDGYLDLMTRNGRQVVEHVLVGRYQVVLAVLVQE